MAFDSLQQAVIEGDAAETARLVQQHLDEGRPALEILDEGLIAAMDDVGARFSAGELFIPEMLVCAEAMQEGLALLRPLLVEGAGFTVVDLGTDVAPEEFVAAARKHAAAVVGMSALLVTTMPQMKHTVEQLRAAGLPARVIVGGAPLTQAYADEIAADGYASDAPGAVVLCKGMVG